MADSAVVDLVSPSAAPKHGNDAGNAETKEQDSDRYILSLIPIKDTFPLESLFRSFRESGPPTLVIVEDDKRSARNDSEQQGKRINLGRNDQTKIQREALSRELADVRLVSQTGSEEQLPKVLLTVRKDPQKHLVHVNGTKLFNQTIYLKQGDVLGLMDALFLYRVEIGPFQPETIELVESDDDDDDDSEVEIESISSNATDNNIKMDADINSKDDGRNVGIDEKSSTISESEGKVHTTVQSRKRKACGCAMCPQEMSYEELEQMYLERKRKQFEVDLTKDDDNVTAAVKPDDARGGSAFRNLAKKTEQFNTHITKVKQEKTELKTTLKEAEEDLEDEKELVQQQALVTDVWQGRFDEVFKLAMEAGVDVKKLNSIRDRPLTDSTYLPPTNK